MPINANLSISTPRILKMDKLALAQIGKNWQICPFQPLKFENGQIGIEINWQKLPKIGKNWQKSAKIGKNWQKLAKNIF